MGYEAGKHGQHHHQQHGKQIGGVFLKEVTKCAGNVLKPFRQRRLRAAVLNQTERIGGDVFIHEIPLAHQLHLGCVPPQRIQRFLRHAVQCLGMIVHQFGARVMKVEKRRIFPLFP